MADISLQDIIDQANAKARQQQLMAMGFGILGARTGNPWMALGQGGLIGMQAGSQARQDYLRQALEQFQLQKQAGMMDLAQKYLAEDQGGQAPPSAQIAPQMQLSPNTPLTGAEAGAGGAPSSSLIGGVPLTPMIPQGTPPSQVQGYTPPNWRQEVPAAAKGFGLMSQDPKLITDLIKWGSETKIGPDGTVTTMTGRPIYKQTDAGVQLYTPQGTPGAFLEYSPENTQAAAQRNAAIEGAKARAVEQAKAEQDLVSVNVGRQTQQMSRAEALARLGGGVPQGGWQPGQPLPPVPAGSTIRTTADGIPYMAPPGAPQVPFPAGPGAGGGQFGLTADPLATKQAEVNMQAMAPVFAKQHEAIDTEAKAASDLKARLTEMSRLLDSFQPNMAAPARQKLAEAVRATQLPFAPDVANAVAGGDLNAMLMFRKNAIQTAFEAARNQMGGVPRNYFEIQMQLEANPSLSLTPEANKGILSIMLGVQQRALDKQSQRDKWLQDHQDLRGFESYFNQKYPSTDYLPPVDTLKQQFGMTDQSQAKPTRYRYENGRLIPQ